MPKFFFVAVILALLVACGGNGTDPAPQTDATVDAPESGGSVEPTAEGEPTEPDDDKAACVYPLHDDLTGETEELAAIPNAFYLSDSFESENGLAVAIADTKGELDATIIAPPCKRQELLELIDAVQASDKQQAQDGVPFEERVYP